MDCNKQGTLNVLWKETRASWGRGELGGSGVGHVSQPWPMIRGFN